MDEEYEVIVLGTGLKECILSGLLSVDGVKVLHMDRNDYYGGESTSLNLSQLWKKFRGEDKAPEHLGSSKDYNVDMMPKFMMGNGKLVRTLIHTDVTKYLSFKAVDGSYVFVKGKVEKVPVTPMEALKSPLMDISEKRRAGKFFSYVQDYDEKDPKTHDGMDLTKVTTKELFAKFGLDENTIDFIGHAVALHTNDQHLNQPALDTVMRMKLYAESLARSQGSSPYIYPLDGLGELPQAFARLSAVYGGTYMLNKPECKVEFDEEGKVTGVTSEGETARCKKIVCDPSYLPNKVRKIGRVARAIAIMSHPIPNTNDSHSVQVIIPQKQLARKSDMYVFCCSYSHNVAPKGKFIAFVSTDAETDDPQTELKAGIDLLGPVDEIFFDVYDRYEPVNEPALDNCFISTSYDATTHFETTVADVLNMYTRITGKANVISCAGLFGKDMDNNTSLMLIDNDGSFEIDDQSNMDVDASNNNSMALVTPTRPTEDVPNVDTDDGFLPQPGTRRRRKKSMVWEHFTIETSSPGSSKACCKHCRKSFAYITGQKLAGTSHLKRHIQLGICPMSRDTHPQLTQVSDTKDATTCPPKKRLRASATQMNVPLDQDRCYSEMAKMIIMHEYPLHMVEHSGFTCFVHALRPQLSMASFHTIHADCVAMYLSEKQKLSTFISEIPGQVNLTIDLWTSNQSVGYAFVTGHFIDKDWNLTHRLLNVAVVPSPDSDFALNQPIAACLSDWNLERRLCSLTVGQSVVNKTSIENLRCCLSARNQHVMNGQLLLGNCYAGLLSSMALDVLGADVLQTPIKKVRDSVKHVKTKDSCAERFDELKTQLQIPSTKDLHIDNQTKWDTTYSMLLAASEYKEVFSCLGNCDLEYKISTSPEEWRKIEVLCSCLKILFDAANVLTGPTRLTANDLYHEMIKLQLELSHTAMSEELDFRNLVTPLREKFDEYWRGCFLLLAVAVVMDPRFKMKLIEFSFSNAYGEDADKWIRSVDDAVHDLYHDYAEQSHSLLEAYVGHGTDGFSETDISQVHFHPEYNHSNELSHDQIYEQLGDGNLLNEKPRDHALDSHIEETQLVEELPCESQPIEGDHALDSHESQEVAQTEETQLVEELPCGSHPIEELLLESQQVEDTDVMQDTQAVEEVTQEAQLVEEKHGNSDIQTVEEVGHETQLVEEKHGDDDIEPAAEVGHDTQQVEEMVENTEPVEQVAQEAPLVEEKNGDDDIQPVEEVRHDTQQVEKIVENTEPVEQVAQEAHLLQEKHDDIEHVEEAEHETQPVEEIIERTQPVPEHNQNPRNGDSQSHAMPQEEAAFTIPQEDHHVDVLLQEGHHLEASSQEFPLITIGDGFSDFELYISEVGSREQMKSELDQYLEETLIPRSPDFEVLRWWSLNRTKYPTLSKMAADVLSLPFCTVSPDSVFDTEVKKMDNYRSSLGQVTLEALFCAKDWLKHGSNASTSENNVKREP